MQKVGNQQGLIYETCRYGTSRMSFRGPPKPLDRPYVSVLGGSEAYGRFVRRPFPDLLEATLGETVVNLGCMNAGLTIFATDQGIIQIAGAARICVLQVLGAQNMSNRLYSVHPRRNDRFLRASDRMKRLFPDVDFSQINFTGHLLQTLTQAEKEPRELLHGEMRYAWLARMRGLLRAMPCPVVLLWLGPRRPDDPWDIRNPFDPLYVDRDMLDALAPDVAGLIEVPRQAEDALAGKHFDAAHREAAAASPGPAFHAMVARALADVVADPAQEKSRARMPDAALKRL